MPTARSDTSGSVRASETSRPNARALALGVPRAVALRLALVALALTGATTALAEDAHPTDDPAEACFSAAERAQPLLRQKKIREARALLDVCARDACPRVARTDCRQWLAEATDAQPSIVVAAHAVSGSGASVDVPGVRVVIDDALVVEATEGTPIVIDPGGIASASSAPTRHRWCRTSRSARARRTASSTSPGARPRP